MHVTKLISRLLFYSRPFRCVFVAVNNIGFIFKTSAPYDCIVLAILVEEVMTDPQVKCKS